MTRPRRLSRSFLACLIALAVMGVAPAFADTSTSTQGSVEVVDVGSLNVQFSNNNIVFTIEDGTPPGITTSTGATAHAQLTVSISDTRADQNRSPYTISLQMGAFTHNDHESIVIPSANLAVMEVQGLVDGISAGFSAPASLSESVTIANASSPPAGETLLTVTISLYIPAGMMPGEFSGSASLDVVN